MRTIYLYLFSLIGLVLITIGLVRLVDLGLKIYIFKNADRIIMYPESPATLMPSKMPSDIGQQKELTTEEKELYKQQQLEYETKQRETDRERTAANALAMIFVGIPLFFYHWKIIQKDKKN